METPWGPSQQITRHSADIIEVSTASHGGFRVTGAALAQIPADWRAFAAQWSHGFGDIWFEEDCACVGVFLTFPHLFPALAEHREAFERHAKSYNLSIPSAAPAPAVQTSLEL